MFKPSPMYVTRAVQQAYGIDHPIGDPFGGAAYGEKNGGGSVGKVFSSVVPMVAGAAMMIGSGGMMAPMLIGGAMFAGGAMSGIGAITGNQTLSKIGGITSAVAGVAGLGYSIYNSEWMTNLASKFASGTDVATTAAGTGAEVTAGGGGIEYAMFGGDTAPVTGSVAADIVNAPTAAAYGGGGYDAGSFAGEMQNQINLAGNTPLNYSTANSFAGPVTSPINTTAGANAIANTGMGSVTLPGGGDYGVSLANGNVINSSGQLLGTSPGFASNTLPTVYGGADLGAMNSGSSGLLSSVGSFIKDNPVVSLMGLQTLGGLAEGASPKSQAEGELLQAQQALVEAETNYVNSGKSAQAEIEFNRAKAYEQEKRKAYNDSIIALQNPQTQNLAQTMYGGAQTGLINQARA